MASAPSSKALTSAAHAVVKTPLDHFPPLVIYTCLTDATDQLAAAAGAAIATEAEPTSEVITMPRRGLGPRPVEILSPQARCAFAALVTSLEPAFPQSSRRSGAWNEFRDFGRHGTHSYVVELDFASCYEFIDHNELKSELLVRYFDVQTVSMLQQQLSGLGQRGRGLPQMLEASDRLADCYLSIIDRKLARRGHLVRRYADDIRVLADSWDVANDIVELAADEARALGLVLSSGKTSIRKRESVDAAEREPIEFLRTIVDDVTEDLTEWIEVSVGRYATALEIISPEQEQILQKAYSRVLDTWHEAFRTSQEDGTPLRLPEGMAAHVGPAVSVMIGNDARLDEDLLLDLVFQDAGRLETVCRYVIGRRERSARESWSRAVGRLIGMGRQSPWSKLWLLHTIDQTVGRRNVTSKMLEWMSDQTGDAHEVVRACSAWTLAGSGLLTVQALDHIYRRSSPVSQPALAAAASRQNRLASNAADVAQLDPKIVNAIRDDSELNKQAFEWAKQ